MEKGDQVFITFEKKLHVLLAILDNYQLTVVMNSLRDSFPFVRSKRFISKSIILIKRILRTLKKKKVIMTGDIDIFLHDNKIKYDKQDIYNVLKSIGQVSEKYS